MGVTGFGPGYGWVPPGFQATGGNYMIGPDGLPITGMPMMNPITSAYQPLSGSGLMLPPGLSPMSPMVPLPGLDPMVSSPQVAASLSAQQAATTSMLLSQLKILTGDIERQFAAIRDHMREIAGDFAGQGTGRAPSEHKRAPRAKTPEPEEGERPAPAHGRHPKKSKGEPETDEEEPPHAPLRGMGFKKGHEEFSVRNLLQRSAYHSSNLLRSRLGRYVEGEEDAGSHGTVNLIGNLSARALKSAGKGESIAEEIPGAKGVAGGLGFAVAGAGVLATGLQRQREINRTYQSIYGGQNFSLTDPQSGFRQRLGENVFGWSQIGTMGAGRARELYEGVSELGIQGDERQGALSFATQQYRRVGMSPQDSMALIDRMVTHGVTAFGTLSDALERVADTARSAGLNVGNAQKSFGHVLGAVQADVTGTEAAPAIAAGIQTEISKQGQTLSGQLDFTGLLSQRSLMIQASHLGQNPLSYMAQVATDPTLLGKGLQAQMDQVRDAVFTPQVLKWAHDRAEAAMASSGGQLTPADAARIGREMAERGMLNPLQFMAVASQLGLGGVTAANVYEVAAKVALGGFRFDKSLAAGDLPDKGKTIGGKAITTGTDFSSLHYGGSDGVGDANPLDPGASDRAWAMQGQTNQLLSAIGEQGGSVDQAGTSYLNAVQGKSGSGQRSAILEGLLRSKSDLEGKHFVVQTKDGPREVSFEQAFQLYQDQLRTGSVIVRETGKTVAETTGNIGDQGDQGAQSSSQSGPQGSKTPEQVSGTVTIYPSAELQRILRFSSSGGAYVDTANRAGLPVPAFPQTPADYPSASGNR